MTDELLAEAHRLLDWDRSQGAGLDGTDDSIWFVQGMLASMSEDADEEPAERALRCFAYSVYVAELLAATCADVRVVVDGEGWRVEEVRAVQSNGGPAQFVLSWVTACVADPDADDILFKYAGALRDFGESARAQALLDYLSG